MIEEFELSLFLRSEKTLCDGRCEAAPCCVNVARKNRVIKSAHLYQSVIGEDLYPGSLRLGVDVQDHPIGTKRLLNLRKGVDDALRGDSSQ